MNATKTPSGRWKVTMINPNFDEMEAGPAIDRLVAEKVMGWTIKPRHNGFTSPATHLSWGPSEGIEDAWVVVERMIALGKMFSQCTHGHDNEEWSVSFGTANALADTAPLAICRAALKAVSTANEEPRR
jgi:hypothetical protein